MPTAIDFDPHSAALDRIVNSWLPLTFAVNSINRSMGIADLYPFVLAPPVIVKLSFIHDRIHQAAGPRRLDQGRGALRGRDRQHEAGRGFAAIKPSYIEFRY